MDWITIRWDLIDLKWVGTFLLALYGASLATYREVMACLERRAVVKVRLSLDIVMIGNGTTIPQTQIWVENHGRTDIIFNSNSVSIETKGYDKFLLMMDPLSNVQFPHTLKPGGSLYLMRDRKPFAEALEKTGREHSFCVTL
jgi:hypothetical protein